MFQINWKLKALLYKIFIFFNLKKIFYLTQKYITKRSRINIQNINCYSNEGNVWRKSNIEFINSNELKILIKEKFKSERGRINCSLLEKNSKWRWLGIQYVVAKY